MPRVSVVIQCYKDRGYICEAIESVLGQSYKDYDLTLSSDGNPELEKYADKYEINFSLSTKHNHSFSVNEAINSTTGEWIKVLDDDDLLTLDSLKTSMENINGDLLQGNAIMFNKNGSRLYKGKEINIHSLLPLIHNPINWSTVIFSREGYNKVGGFDPMVHFANDYDFYLNFLRHGLKIGYINEPLSYYRLHEGQMTKNATFFKSTEKIYLQNKYADYIRTVMANDDMAWHT